LRGDFEEKKSVKKDKVGEKKKKIKNPR
jgi:hypothetical protein